MRVAVAVPNLHWIHKGVVAALLTMLKDRRYHVTFSMPTAMPIENNRNRIVKDFLAGDGDYLLMIDADNPPIQNPLDLVLLNKDIMVCPTPQWRATEEDLAAGRFPIFWNCMDEKDGAWTPHRNMEGLQEIDAGGTGCMLIARRVLEQMKFPFERTWRDDGTVECGSDFWFCKKAKDLGFSVWAHYDYRCRHHKEVEMCDLHHALMVRDISWASTPNINTAEYWDEQWAKREPREYPFYKTIVEMCGTGSVLDFGCGRGDLLELLDKRGEAVGLDISSKAVEICRERGLTAMVGSTIDTQWDAIVATELLEHVDDDEGLLREFFEHTDRVIYTVPNNCLPPGVEPEHRRVYSKAYVEQITPHLKEIITVDQYLLVLAERQDG